MPKTVLDPTVVVQDRVLADRVQSDGRACVVVCNKWDLVEDKNDASYNKVHGYYN